MSIGCIPIGLAIGAIIYVLVYKAVSAYREQRRLRIAGRRQADSGAQTGVGALESESRQ